jgi:hypothetical protein
MIRIITTVAVAGALFVRSGHDGFCYARSDDLGSLIPMACLPKSRTALDRERSLAF